VGVILRNSQHLSDLVSDVLELARVDSSPTGLQRRWTRLADIIQEADAAIRPLFEAKGLYLRTELPNTDLRLYCDGLRIRQVLLNLLSNAARATEKGGVIVTAWVSDGRANVSVADTGPGISPEDQERIFEPFRQAGDSILRRNAGSGLGLTLSRRFVDLHGGKLSLESQVGVGSVFSFTLPLQPVEALSAPALQRWFNPYTQYEARDRPSKARPLDLRSRYLVLESGDTLSRLLERHEAGIEVLHVDNQEKMLTEVARALPRVVIINHTPPTEIPSLLTTHDLPYGLPILGCWVPSVREAAERLGVQDYLVKPVNSEDMFAALDGIGDVRSTLLIDDNIDAVQLFTRMLKSSRPHLRILSTTSCKRALDLLRIQRPDVILLDLVMPGMTGYDFLSIKSQQPNLRDIPVIAISAQDPAQTPLGNDTITISRTGGLSLRDLFTCVRQISEVLAPETAPDHQESSTDPPV
jgi:CheY-like chemotaxis protein/anti-sigma regulatory factor (Ser/Thr protein kinase)